MIFHQPEAEYALGAHAMACFRPEDAQQEVRILFDLEPAKCPIRHYESVKCSSLNSQGWLSNSSCNKEECYCLHLNCSRKKLEEE